MPASGPGSCTWISAELGPRDASNGNNLFGPLFGSPVAISSSLDAPGGGYVVVGNPSPNSTLYPTVLYKLAPQTYYAGVYWELKDSSVAPSTPTIKFSAASGNNYGAAVAISASGAYAAVGAPRFTPTGGLVNVQFLNDTLSSIVSANSTGSVANPA
jgi:hypothetical protein